MITLDNNTISFTPSQFIIIKEKEEMSRLSLEKEIFIVNQNKINYELITRFLNESFGR